MSAPNPFLYRISNGRAIGFTKRNLPPNSCIACWTSQARQVTLNDDKSCPHCKRTAVQQVMSQPRRRAKF